MERKIKNRYRAAVHSVSPTHHLETQLRDEGIRARRRRRRRVSHSTGAVGMEERTKLGDKYGNIQILVQVDGILTLLARVCYRTTIPYNTASCNNPTQPNPAQPPPLLPYPQTPAPSHPGTSSNHLPATPPSANHPSLPFPPIHGFRSPFPKITQDACLSPRPHPTLPPIYDISQPNAI